MIKLQDKKRLELKFFELDIEIRNILRNYPYPPKNIEFISSTIFSKPFYVKMIKDRIITV
jgi:hypothetical protein